MTIELPGTWNLDTADSVRDESKRSTSPCSYFFVQAQTLQLAAAYFSDDRLAASARGGVARKHRHKIHLALYGQLMAAFEYMLKDFVARAIDVTTVLDNALEKADWFNLNPAKVLTSRSTSTTPGAILVHATLGWHDPEKVNKRYKDLFSVEPFDADAVADLNRLWILRHSVAHNAGYITAYDSTRLGSHNLADAVVNINAEFIGQARDRLVPLAEHIAQVVGGALTSRWFDSVKEGGPNWERDSVTYTSLWQLSLCIKSRNQELGDPREKDYRAAFPDGA